MPGLEDLGRFLAESPGWQQGLAMMANESPEIGFQRASAAQTMRASQEEAERRKQAQKILGQMLAKGNIAPEDLAMLAESDPDLAYKFYQEQRKAQQADISYQFNPVTGELVAIDKKSGSASLMKPQGAAGMPSATGGGNAPGGLKIPPNILDNPKATQKYLEEQAKLTAEKQASDQTKSEAASGLDQSLTELDGLVDRLNDMGGLVNSQKSLNQNVLASAKATDIGQKITRATGSEEQAIRDEIGMLVPALMQDIKKVTGMTASEINSIPEMELLRRSVGGDTSIPYSAIKNNIQRVREKYVTRAGVKSDRGEAPAAKAQPSRSDVEAELRRRGVLK